MLKDNKITITRIIVSLIVFIVGICVDSYLGFAIVILAYLIVSIKVIKKSFCHLMEGQIFDENFLMLVATLGAFITKQYLEAISVMIIYEIGEMLQDKAVDDSHKLITELIDVRPKFANLQKDDRVDKVLPKDVKVGEIVVVGVGEKIPLDGVIVKGESNIDFSSLTGESLPKYSRVGDLVYSGGINKNSTLYIEVTRKYEESTISRMFDFIEKANAKKSRLENFMTRFSKKYTPIVIACAVLFIFLAYSVEIIERIRRACMFLVIACPCALIISIPVSFFYGVGMCSKNGILVKGSVYLEILSKVTDIIFDKTGTLTKGVFKVVKINDIYNKGILEIASYCESSSNHPIAVAIVDAYGKDMNYDRLNDSKEIAGLGTSCMLDNKNVFVGNKKFMTNNNILVDEALEDDGLVYVAYDNQYIGYIVVQDKIKDEAKCVLDGLRENNIGLAMITGDDKKTALHIGEKLEIVDVFYEVLPEDKANIVSDYMKNKKSKVAFVGDGINDVLSILTAHCGIAMGGIGSDAAIEASNIVIMDDDLEKIGEAIKISKKTVSLVWQNIIFILGVKFLVAVLCGVGIANMWEAIVADVGVSLIAILHVTRSFKKGWK